MCFYCSSLEILSLTTPSKSILSCIIIILAGTFCFLLVQGCLDGVTDRVHFIRGLLSSEQEPGE